MRDAIHQHVFLELAEGGELEDIDAHLFEQARDYTQKRTQFIGRGGS